MANFPFASRRDVKSSHTAPVFSGGLANSSLAFRFCSKKEEISLAEISRITSSLGHRLQTHNRYLLSNAAANKVRRAVRKRATVQAQ